MFRVPDNESQTIHPIQQLIGSALRRPASPLPGRASLLAPAAARLAAVWCPDNRSYIAAQKSGRVTLRLTIVQHTGPISVLTGETVLAAALRPGDLIHTGTPEGVGEITVTIG